MISQAPFGTANEREYQVPETAGPRGGMPTGLFELAQIIFAIALAVACAEIARRATRRDERKRALRSINATRRAMFEVGPPPGKSELERASFIHGWTKATAMVQYLVENEALP